MPSYSRRTYNKYKTRCKRLGIPSVEFRRYETAYNNQIRVVNYMLDVLKRKNPYVISQLDDRMVLYAGVKGDQVVINYWTNEECKALTGVEVKPSVPETIR